MTGSGSLVLLRDPDWPEQPGVCCWRHSARAAFAALGLAVTVTTPAGAEAGALAVPPAPASLAAADLVLAESIGVAQAAVAAGVARSRLLAFALPPDPHRSGVPSQFAEGLAAAAPVVRGFVTDSELARESVEQALAGIRPVVMLFPPLAVDRTCPVCGSAGEVTAPSDDAGPEVGQLREWHGLIARLNAGGLTEVPYSFPAGRLLGPPAPRAPGGLAGWPATDPPAAYCPDWTAAAQDRAAGRIWAATRPPVAARAPRTVLVTGTNLKFATELAERLDNRPDLTVTVDEWERWSEPTALTGKLLDGAESVFAEWLGPSTAWVSRHKRPGQFLVARQHRYELDTPRPRQIAVENLDAVVYIAPRFGRRIRDELGWPVDKLVYLPNFLDVDWLDRPKLPGARFGIGMVGIESIRKRFDLALDLVAAVRQVDPRFTLFVRSVLPWDNPIFWRRCREREYAGWCMERIRHDPLLRGGVIFDPPGRDMARWYRTVGHILSTSDDEGSHMAPAEGMASGSVPVIRPWPGAAEIYAREWLHTSTEEAAAAILDSADDPDGWADRAARARAEVRRTHDPLKVVAGWADLLHGDVAAARRHFADYAAL